MVFNEGMTSYQDEQIERILSGPDANYGPKDVSDQGGGWCDFSEESEEEWM